MLRLSQQGERKQTKLDRIGSDTPYDYGVAELEKILQMCIGILIRLAAERLACTMLMRLDLSSKFTSPTLMLGPVATLSVEGTENSRRIFSAIASRTSGASGMGSCAGRIARGGTTRCHALLMSFSGLSV